MSTSCSTNQLVTWRSSSARIRVAIRPCLSSDATPLVGSSMISSLGRSIKAIATSSSLRWPSGSDAQGSSARSRRPTRSSVCSTSRLSTESRSDRKNDKPPCRPAAAISRHCRTVCSRNNCGSWNERPSPRCTMRRGAMPVTSRPSKKTLPDVGLRKPVQRLMNVVLPAPFWPITARRSPACNSKLMLSATTTAPNASCRPSVRTRAGMLSPSAARAGWLRSGAAGRRCRRVRPGSPRSASGPAATAKPQPCRPPQ